MKITLSFIAIIIFAYVQSTLASSELHHSPNSGFILRNIQSGPNAVLISPDKKSIAVIFHGDSPLTLLAPADFPYAVSTEIMAADSRELARIVLAKNKTELIDYIIISRDNKISFAEPQEVQLLRKKVQDAKNDLRELMDRLSDLATKAEQGAAANP